MSVEMWISPSSGPRGVVYSNYDATTTNGFYIRLDNTSLKFQIDAYNKPGSTYYRTLLNQTGSALPLNHWSHCVFTFDTSHVKIYLNGEFDTQVATRSQGIGFTSGFNTLLGYDAALNNYFSGLIGQKESFTITYNMCMGKVELPAQRLKTKCNRPFRVIYIRNLHRMDGW